MSKPCRDSQTSGFETSAFHLKHFRELEWMLSMNVPPCKRVEREQENPSVESPLSGQYGASWIKTGKELLARRRKGGM